MTSLLTRPLMLDDPEFKSATNQKAKDAIAAASKTVKRINPRTLKDVASTVDAHRDLEGVRTNLDNTDKELEHNAMQLIGYNTQDPADQAKIRVHSVRR